MPSPATVIIVLFVVSLVGTAASAAALPLPPELAYEVVSRLDSFTDLVSWSQSCRMAADVSASIRRLWRLFHDRSIEPEALVAVARSLCLRSEPIVQKMLRRETKYDTILDLVERLVFSDGDDDNDDSSWFDDARLSQSEAARAEALSLLVRTCGPVAADVISGALAPSDCNDIRLSARLCRIRAAVVGLDFRSASTAALPTEILRRINDFATHSIPELMPTNLPQTDVIQGQYPAPFNVIFPNNADLGNYLLVFPKVCEQLQTAAVLQQLMRFGILFDAEDFLCSVRLRPQLVAQLYPLLRKRPQTDWLRVLDRLLALDAVDVTDALFRINDFSARLSAMPGAHSGYLNLCVSAMKLRHHEFFMVLAHHPLMDAVINRPLAASCDSLLDRSRLLHLAVRLNCHAEVTLLLSSAKLEIDALDGGAHSALHYAWRFRTRMTLLREISTRRVVYGLKVKRMSWMNRLLLETVF